MVYSQESPFYISNVGFFIGPIKIGFESGKMRNENALWLILFQLNNAR